MSLAAMTWAINAPINRPTAKLLLVCLSDHADEEGVCFPSQKALAEKVGVTDRAIRDALVWLEEQGFISRSMRHRKDGSRTSDAYQLPDEAYRKNFPPPRKQTQGQPEDISGLTSFEPVTEPTTAQPRATAFDELLEKLLSAAGIPNFRDERDPGLAFVGPIQGLIDGGYDLERDILPVIQAKCASGFKPRRWSYFVPIIQDEASARRAAASKPKATAQPVDWGDWVEGFYADGVWQDRLGPRPGEAGCRAPPDIVAKFAGAAA